MITMNKNTLFWTLIGGSLLATLFLSLCFNFFAADEYTYMNTADAILAGNFLENGDVARMPLFYAGLTGVFFIFGSSEATAKIFVWILLAIGTIGIYFLSKELLKDKKRALFATAIFATSPLTIFFATRVLTETMFCLFVIIIALLFVKSEKNNKLFLATGFFIAMLTLTRYVGLYAFFIIGIYWIVNKEWKNIFSKKALYILIGFLVGLIPYFIMNYLITGSPIGLILDFFGAQFGVSQGTMSWPDRVPVYFIIIPFLIGTCSILFWLFFVKNHSKKELLKKENLFPLAFIFGQWLPMEIFSLKSAALIRYVFGLTPFMAILSAKIINTKRMEKIAFALIIINLIIGLTGTAVFYSIYEKHQGYAFIGEETKTSCTSYISNIDFVLLHYTKQTSVKLEEANCFVSSTVDGGTKECPANFDLIQSFKNNKMFICKSKV